jgi:CheY-like chemotaxis protein
LLKQLKDITVIYIEDDNASRILIKNALENMVYRVYLAENGEEGLALYKKVLPDIVLTDMLMPKMNGLEMAKKIRAIQPKQAIGMFTGDLEHSLARQDSSGAIDIHLYKPLNRKEFYKALIKLTELSRNLDSLAKKVNITKNDILKDI